jgi:hypothetical protein
MPEICEICRKRPVVEVVNLGGHEPMIGLCQECLDMAQAVIEEEEGV